MCTEGQILEKQNQIISTYQASDFSISYCGKLISLIAFVDPTHVNNEDEKQNAPLAEFNAYMESFDCFPFTQPQNSSQHHRMRYGM